jgi:hypothetical protein
MSSLAPIYEPWGGNAEAMAADIGEKPVTVRQWRNRGSIPPLYWRKIITAAEARGARLTLDQFVPERAAA